MIFKSASFFIVLLILSLSACKQKTETKHQSPRDLFPGLFEAVQAGHVFEDSKTFTDCMPKRDPEDILKTYQEEKNKAGFNLKAFVDKNFSLPEEVAKDYQTNIRAGVEPHIRSLWDVLTRRPDKYYQYSSLLALPQPYVVPGGRFREVYYWDSYFTMLGLEESGRTDLIESMVNNFAYLIRTYGFIPNGNRTYYLTRSQPPYFSLMVKLLMENKKLKGDSVLKANRDALEREYSFWMNNNDAKKGANLHVVFMPDGEKLNRYFDSGDWPREEAYSEDVAIAANSSASKPEVYRHLRSGAESGWDYSSRWFSDGKTLNTIQTTDIIPVDLNALLYHLEIMLAKAYQIGGDDKAKDFMTRSAEQRKIAIMKYCWDKEAGWFRDYNWKSEMATSSMSLAGVYPMYFNMIATSRADTMANTLQQKFLKPGGLVSTLATTGQQWDAPNGWAPLQWMAIAGLSTYKKEELSREVSRRWSSLNVNVFNKTGKLMEKYNVVDTAVFAGGGEYPNQDGFGWTNGVLLKILARQKNQSIQ
ncbi:alpha,alpha-trehalase [Arcticibacter pallidicorallinus]|uniref:Alpha,alpha-trehalase n=1 Tax=Arcticibacter pallidicorallinus TaxID=1259464 RepID=A0A2T0TW30_9SPHI|nr:alpha,alpha-trehalase TreF [Arcticibacter pallidicorallinus]PRY49865.1 alpha,alpha-trehalase [Arcticibacter pallidicorallinus]